MKIKLRSTNVARKTQLALDQGCARMAGARSSDKSQHEEAPLDIHLTAEELRTAPRGVREWIIANLQLQLASTRATEQTTQEELAALSPTNATILVGRIGQDLVAAHVLFEIGHLAIAIGQGSGGCVVHLDDLLHHVRIGGPDALLQVLQRIEAAFEQAFPEAKAALLGFDRAGNVYVSAETRASIQELWQAVAAGNLERLIEGNSRGADAQPLGVRLPPLVPSTEGFREEA